MQHRCFRLILVQGSAAFQGSVFVSVDVSWSFVRIRSRFRVQFLAASMFPAHFFVRSRFSVHFLAASVFPDQFLGFGRVSGFSRCQRRCFWDIFTVRSHVIVQFFAVSMFARHFLGLGRVLGLILSASMFPDLFLGSVAF